MIKLWNLVSRKEKRLVISLIFSCIILIILVLIPNRNLFLNIIFYSIAIISLIILFNWHRCVKKREKESKRILLE